MIKFLRVFVYLIGTILALFLAKFVNLFKYIPFVPDDKSFDICITTYCAIIEIFMDFVYTKIFECFEKHRVYVECVCFIDSNNISISNTPSVTFSGIDIARLSVQVSIRGNADALKSSTIIIYSMSQTDFQIEHSGTSLSLDSNGNLSINLKQMCGNQKKVNVNESFKFMLIRNLSNSNATCTLAPTIEGRTKFLVFKDNTARILIGEN